MRLVTKLDRVGPFWVGVIFAILCGNAVYFAQALIATWAPADPSIVTAGGFIRGNDFIALWTALDLAVGGKAGAIYDAGAIQAAQQQLTGLETTADRRFLSPPTFLLMVLPLGLLPYLTALSLWQIVPLVAFLLVMARMGLPPLLYWLLPLSAAVVQTIVTGQNGLLTALLLAGGLLSIERHPRVAGVLLALVTFKPQLALLIAPALLIGGYWRALGAMVAALTVLILVSVAVFGLGPWLAFFHNLSYAQDQLALGHLPWRRMPTVFVAARMSGLDAAAAQLVQGAVALCVVAGVAWAWWRGVPFGLKAALLVAAIPLTTPWAHDYDLVILLLPIGWLILEEQRARLRFAEITILVLVWMLPSWWALALVRETGVQFGPVILLAFYGMILNRALRTQSAD
jgi:hypothetical protein